MNGVVFQTSAMITAHLAGHSLPVHRTVVLKSLLPMPSKAKMNSHSLAVTAVGMAHGTRTAARTRLRPLKARAMMTAIQKPSTVSSATVTMVKKKVVAVADQNCAPSVPGGQSTVPPLGAGHCWKIQLV